jgi:hypothetical protein
MAKAIYTMLIHDLLVGWGEEIELALIARASGA